MKNAAQTRVLAIVLALATVAVCVLAAMNFEHENSLDVPTDGVWWVEANGGLRAERVPTESPGHRAGIRTGDILVSVDNQPTTRVASLGREMFRSGIWAHATYSILRPVPQSVDLHGATRLDIQVILEPKDRSINQGLRFIALVYLCIGIYVLFRRWTAPKSIHFYVFCLASFVLYSFRSTGELGIFDWGNMVAQALAAGAVPALCRQFLGQLRLRTAQPLQTAVDLRPALCAGNLSSRSAIHGDPFLVGDRGPAAPSGSDFARLSCALLRHRGDRLPVALPPGRVRAGAPATEVAYARHPARGNSLHASTSFPISPTGRCPVR